MKMDETVDVLSAVSDVARIAGNVAMAHFRTTLAIESKGDGSPVTIADRNAELAARSWITEQFPLDGVVGEEFGEQNTTRARRWLIDPIDGTKSFVRGVPLWATLVALCEGTSVIAGAAYFPAVGELIAAAPGQGCWCNGARVAVSKIDSLGGSTVLTTDPRFPGQESRRERWEAISAGSMISRTWGDAYGYLMVATGRAEVMIDPVMNPWDAAPFLPIIEEAGGVFTDWSGARTVFGGSAIATNRAVSDAVRQILRGDGA